MAPPTPRTSFPGAYPKSPPGPNTDTVQPPRSSTSTYQGSTPFGCQPKLPTRHLSDLIAPSSLLTELQHIWYHWMRIFVRSLLVPLSLHLKYLCLCSTIQFKAF
ncbi:hypothetical protein M408DRAFT_29417 [Serendipita vermifera MAFF 305830]|uniref:Uncharacterized protein n=1 Tax=Serendipita vermifera MAFF 305830 TaxID=933852 RepID=A0A0C2WW69_SERVB|nr:hypothetical protein M408DRAFT_29417 [Serendipita vermifera MAFF 305830]